MQCFGIKGADARRQAEARQRAEAARVEANIAAAVQRSRDQARRISIVELGWHLAELGGGDQDATIIQRSWRRWNEPRVRLVVGGGGPTRNPEMNARIQALLYPDPNRFMTQESIRHRFDAGVARQRAQEEEEEEARAAAAVLANQSAQEEARAAAITAADESVSVAGASLVRGKGEIGF